LAQVAPRVDLLRRPVPPSGFVAGDGLCSTRGGVSAWVVKPLTLAGRRGTERVAAGDAVAVAVCGDRADVLLPCRPSRGVSGWRADPPHPRLPLLDGLTGERGSALLDQLS
jgi:hypothetical protein